MERRKFRLVVLVTAVLSLAWGWAEVRAEAAPDLRLTTVKGEELKLADYKGKVVLLNFFGSWCGPCRKEAPELVKLQRKMEAKGLQIIGLAVSSPLNDVKDFISKYKINYPVALYGEKELKSYGGVRAVPTTFFVDKKGQMAGGVEGLVPAKTLEDKVKELLAAAG
jgi:peroxiredoxin